MIRASSLSGATTAQRTMQKNGHKRLIDKGRALAFGVLIAAMTLTADMAGAAESQKMSAEVGKPLKAAQEAMAKKQWNVALDKIKEAEAVGSKTPSEQYTIDSLLAYVLFQQKKLAEAVVVYEKMLNSGQMPAGEVDERTKTVAQMHFQLKNYDKAIAAAKKVLAKQPNQPDMAVLVGQSYYLTRDFKSAASTMAGLVSSAEKAGQTPKEDWLRIVHASNHEMNNPEGISESLKKLVRYYQKPEDWDGLLASYSRRTYPDRVKLGLYRLMLDANVLKRPADYVETAQLAMDAGVPSEAQQVMEKGVANGTLKSTDKTQQGKYDRLLEGSKKQVEANRASLPDLSKNAATAPTGQSDVVLGHVYMSYGQYDEAIGALQRGIRKGGVSDVDEAQVSLGIAYMRKGQKDLARQAFKSVGKDSKWSELAELWTLRV